MPLRFNKSRSSEGIAYFRKGNGTPLLLIHGVGLCAESWYPLVDTLADDFELFVIDLPGHAQSQALNQTFEEVSLKDYVELIQRFTIELNLQNYIVCGHSLGALIAIEMAANQSNTIVGLAALNSVYQRSTSALEAVQQRALELSKSDSIIGVEKTILRWFGDTPSSVMKKYAELCASWLSANTVMAYALAYKTFAELPGPSISQLDRISCPSVFMTGENDPNSSPAMSQEMSRVCPVGKYRIVRNAAHMMPLTHSEHVCEELKMLAKHNAADHHLLQTTTG